MQLFLLSILNTINDFFDITLTLYDLGLVALSVCFLICVNLHMFLSSDSKAFKLFVLGVSFCYCGLFFGILSSFNLPIM
jgi:hypothetical protein|tara:strand:+ start:399 stop:635 length:237 start_codon:yes stop_codon:yes gene_type:complete